MWRCIRRVYVLHQTGLPTGSQLFDNPVIKIRPGSAYEVWGPTTPPDCATKLSMVLCNVGRAGSVCTSKIKIFTPETRPIKSVGHRSTPSDAPRFCRQQQRTHIARMSEMPDLPKLSPAYLAHRLSSMPELNVNKIFLANNFLNVGRHAGFVGNNLLAAEHRENNKDEAFP